MAGTIPIIDSHIHLYPAQEVETLAWCTPDHALAKRQSVDEFKAAAAAAADRLRGYVLVEADRRSDATAGAGAGTGEDAGWEQPLKELAWARRLAGGADADTADASTDEGYAAADARLLLAVVAWAPVPAGAAALERYLAAAEEAAGAEAWARVRGFRYLLQDKPRGAGLTDGFIEGLRLLGRKGFVFEIGIDQHRHGRAQLEEAVEMIDRAHEGVEEDEKVVFVIDHLCKPDFTVLNPADPSFVAWRAAMYTLSKCKKTYMKLSGGLAEMSDTLREQPASDIFLSICSWLSVVLAAFGPSRIMFGSDWPICTVGTTDAWNKWRLVVERMCWMATLGDEDQARIFGGTAVEAYGIKLP